MTTQDFTLLQEAELDLCKSLAEGDPKDTSRLRGKYIQALKVPEGRVRSEALGSSRVRKT